MTPPAGVSAPTTSTVVPSIRIATTLPSELGRSRRFAPLPSVFATFATVAAVAAVITGLYAVETKGRVLEEASP